MPDVALVSRDELSRTGRLSPVAAALEAAGLTTMQCSYDEDSESETEAALLDCRAALGSGPIDVMRSI